MTIKPAAPKGTFTREIRQMMYAFGDHPLPRDDAVDLVEDLTISYITDVLLKAIAINAITSANSKLRCEDIVHVIRKDVKKMARVEELLFMNQELQKARKAFEMDEGNAPAS